MTTKGGRFGRARALALALLVVTFAAGALGGAAVTRAMHGGVGRPSVGAPAPKFPPRRSIFAEGGPLSERLRLTDAQRTRIEAIVARERPHADSVARQLRERLRAAFDSTNAQIRAVLTPEQRTEFDRFLKERHERMRARYGGRGERH